jgi:hypothetical protein
MKTLAAVTGAMLLSSSAFAYDINGISLGSEVSDFSDCGPSDQWANASWCHHTEAIRNDRGGAAEIGRSRIVRDNTLYYVNFSEDNAAWNPGEISHYLDGLDIHVDGSRGRRTYIKIPGGDAVIAVWGNLQLVPIDANDRASWAMNQSPGNGIMVDYIGDLAKSAQTGLPIFRVMTGVGYVWTASNVGSRGHMRKFAMDADALSGAPMAQAPTGPMPAPTRGERTERRNTDGMASTATLGQSFHAAKPEPLEQQTDLECVPVQTTDTDRRDPVYKITVDLSIDNAEPTDLKVVHTTVSGAIYVRADQYTRSNLTSTPGKTEYFWTGAWTKNLAVTMKGTLMRSVDNKWTYAEQQFRDGGLRFAMLSVCHAIEAE